VGKTSILKAIAQGNLSKIRKFPVLLIWVANGLCSFILGVKHNKAGRVKLLILIFSLQV